MAAFALRPKAVLRLQRIGLPSTRRLSSISSLKETSAPPLILLLDLDETLVRPKIQRVHTARTLSTTDHRIMIDGNIDCSLSVRPGVHEFFDWIRARQASGHIAGPWLYGQGAYNYVKPVLRQIDPTKDIFGDRILVKPSCTPLEPPWPWVLKSFHSVPARGEDVLADSPEGEGSVLEAKKCTPADFPRIILIDNNVMSCILHPENTVVVRDWLGNDAPDTELARVTALLDAVIEADTAEGASGDYQGQLVKATPRFQEFRVLVEAIHETMKELPDPDLPLKKVLIQTWEEACNAKRMLLGLGPKEV